MKNITNSEIGKLWGIWFLTLLFCPSVTVRPSRALAALKYRVKIKFQRIFKNILLLKVGIAALNYKKGFFKIVKSSEIELSIKFKTT